MLSMKESMNMYALFLLEKRKFFMKIIILVLLFVISIVNSFAYEVNLNFDVLSQGSDMYACNAGIGKASGPNNLYGGGNFLMANVAVYENPGDDNLPVPRTVSASGSSLLELAPPSGPFNQKISDVKFLLNSEKYGALYFVEICFRSPSFVSEDDSSRYQLDNSVTVKNILGSYAVNAGLEVRAEWYCSNFNDGLPLLIFDSMADMNNGNSLTGFLDYINPGTAIDKCRIRYIFAELTSDSYSRQIQADDAEFTTSTSIYRVE